MADLRKLQNGSDVRGIAVEGVEGEHVNLTADAVNRIAQAYAIWLAKRLKKEPKELVIGVGHDSRITAEALKSAAFAGMCGQGASCRDCGLVSTPSMFMTTVFPEFLFDGAVMITASHLPFNRNGMKFFTREGGLEHEDIAEILDLAGSLDVCDGEGAAKSVCSLTVYTAHLRDKIKSGVAAEDYEHPLKGLKVVVDAGNGAGGFFAEQVLKPLGADTGGSQFLKPDGMFPNHIPNPENKKAMEAIKSAVLASHADLGLIFDTDVDRMSAVLPDGAQINRDAIIAMIASVLSEEHPGETVVTDSVTSDRLQDFLENRLGMKQHRFKRGYKNVINEAIRLNNEGVMTPLAIETSGHGALKENYFLDDGAYLAVKLLIAAARAARNGKTLASYLEGFREGFDEREFRFKIAGEDYRSYGLQVLETAAQRAKAMGYPAVPNNYEGVRISFHGERIRGWLLFRMSLHDPVIALNMEGERPGDCGRMIDAVKQWFAGFDRVDISCLN